MSMRTHARRRPWRIAYACAAAAALAGLVLVPASAHPSGHRTASTTPKPTVVLVHGAWADSSAWQGVIRRLLACGYPVSAFPTPLAGLSSDSTALRSYLESISGPIVLVGHSYGGAVISDAATGDSQVKALVYVDAFAPEAGETVASLPGPHSAIADPSAFTLVPAGAPTATTELYVRPDVFVKSFANDLPTRRGEILAAVQRPVTVGALNEPATTPAWQTIPSWYEVGTIDRIIPPGKQLWMARRAGAHIVRARTGHLPMISDPAAVTATVLDAARSSG